MNLMSREYGGRLKHWQRTLQQDFYRPVAEIAFEGFTTMEQLTVEEAAKGHFAPVPEGFVWGRTWEYMWVRATVVIPEECAGQTVVMDLNLGGEATLFVNGRAFGTRRAEWVETPHHYMVDNILTEEAVPGEVFDLLFEVYAGHYYPGRDGCATGPVLPGSYQDPKQEGRRTAMGHNTFGVWQEDAYQLWLDVSTLQFLMEELPDTSLRAAKIAGGLEEYTRIVDFEQPREGRLADYRRAREALAPLLAVHNGATMPHMSAVGNSHLDLAWLWPMQETERKTARTFAQQLRLIEKYPEYRYIQSQPAAYEMCRQRYPELYEQICEAVKKGQWIADGAMYVEPDTNMPSGEALIRQVLHGKRYYKDVFGLESRLLWLPDTFGYTAALPQILRKCHVDYLVTQKIFWSYNDADRFPYHYFHWVGMDGSRVTSFLPTSYTYRTDPNEFCQIWKNRVQARDLDEFLVPFGYGDGGGGPCRDHIEYALRGRDLEGMPRVSMESPVDFFDRLQSAGGPRNSWTGELYFSAHRGTFTSQAPIKRNNRRSECALHDFELWGAAAMCRGGSYPLSDADRLWKQLLLMQFHDILPGSSIARVYTEANAAHEALQGEANAYADGFRKQLVQPGKGLTLFNSLGFDRTEVIDLPEGFAQGAQTLEGTPIPVDGGRALVTIPAAGWVSIVPGEKQTAPVAKATLTAGSAVLENSYVRVEIDRQGRIVSFCTGEGRELAGAPMNELHLYKDVPRLFDAWDIDSNYVEQEIPLEGEAELSVECAEGLTAAVRIRRSISNSSFEQVIRLNAHENTVHFDTTVDWHELHRLLKVSFPTTVFAENALHEMQFGYVERPTHRSRRYDKDRYEVCNHRYTALTDQGHSCAVLNDCKYGVSTEGSAISLTLLRAPAAPEMQADNGLHHITYAFEAWEGAFKDAPVVRDGLRLNYPVAAAAGTAPAQSLFTVDRGNVILDTVKPAEDGSGDLILRLYESKKCDTAFTLNTSLPVKCAALCDMLEQPEQELTPGKSMQLHAAPFEVITLRLKV